MYILSLLLIVAGACHFLFPKGFERIIPPYFPNPKLLNKLAGLAEMTLGVGLLYIDTQSIAAWGIMLLLIAVFPANIYMYQKGSFGIPKWILLLRLPLQFVLIYWAYQYV